MIQISVLPPVSEIVQFEEGESTTHNSASGFLSRRALRVPSL